MYALSKINCHILQHNDTPHIVMRGCKNAHPRVHRYGIEMSYRYVVSFIGRQPIPLVDQEIF